MGFFDFLKKSAEPAAPAAPAFPVTLAADAKGTVVAMENIPDEVFAQAQGFWEDARSFGLRFGWAKACMDGGGVRGMLTLARSGEALTAQEVGHNEMKMRWLAHMAHGLLSRIFTTRQAEQIQPNLTAREIEVLKWTADGKTSADISSLLDVSENTVNFHVKNAVFKLQTTNKTAATVRAAMLGLLG